MEEAEKDGGDPKKAEKAENQALCCDGSGETGRMPVLHLIKYRIRAVFADKYIDMPARQYL